MGQPNVTANYGTVAYSGTTAKDSSVCINYNVISDIRMPLYALYGVAVFIKLKALSAQRNSLIYFNVISYL